MNFPAFAKKSFESLKGQIIFDGIFHFVSKHLNLISSPTEKARFIHNVVDNYNKEVFEHQLVKEFSPCKSGCAGCCHTQVAITEEEAILLNESIKNGIVVDQVRLKKQAQAKNDEDLFYQLSYQDRKCVFLDEQNHCKVYKDRPSVCRTNSVIGSSTQCSTENGKSDLSTMRLVKTDKANVAIMASFYNSNETGTLPYLLLKVMNKKSINSRKNLFNDNSL